MLVNYHELLRYELRPPVTTLPFSTELTNFNSILESLKNLNKNLKKDLKYRPKENAGLDSSKRFSKIFGAQFLENPKSLSYYNSIKESKLIICFIPQTSFIEPLYANIPTILVGNNYGFFDNKERKKLLLQMKNNKLFFDNTKEAVKFLNKNWGNIEDWWNKSGTQKIRKKILNFYYSPEKDFSKKLFNLIKTEKQSLIS